MSTDPRSELAVRLRELLQEHRFDLAAEESELRVVRLGDRDIHVRLLPGSDSAGARRVEATFVQRFVPGHR